MPDDLSLLRETVRIADRSRADGNHPFGAPLADPDNAVLIRAGNTFGADRGLGHAELNVACATEDVPVTAVMSIFNMGPHAFYTTTESGMTALADVAGKTVATSPFTSSNVFLPLVLADNDLSMDDITVTNADPGALGPLLMTGQTDVIIAWPSVPTSPGASSPPSRSRSTSRWKTPISPGRRWPRRCRN